MSFFNIQSDTKKLKDNEMLATNRRKSEKIILVGSHFVAKNKKNLVITVATIIIIKWKRLKQYAVKSWIFRSLEMLILVKKVY